MEKQTEENKEIKILNKNEKFVTIHKDGRFTAEEYEAIQKGRLYKFTSYLILTVTWLLGIFSLSYIFKNF